MTEFIKEMTVGNVFLFYHMFGGMVLARFFGLWKRGINPVLMVLCIAILWEILELYLFGYSTYSWGIKGYIADTIGDISGSVIMAWVVTK